MSFDKNYWHDANCAKAFWDQKNGRPYKELVRDTFSSLELREGDQWLDLGCGSGQLTATLWQCGGGTLGRILATDCAAVNVDAIARLRTTVTPQATESQIEFQQVDFSHGLPQIATGSFDGVISGLAISYAESRDPMTGQYNDTAFMNLLCEIARVLKPSGKFVFSINVPNPGFWKVLYRSLKGGHRVSHAGRVLANALRMQFYGRWLKQEARRGRFHFYPIDELVARLARSGFEVTSHRVSYAGQAYVVQARRKLAVAANAA